MTPTYFFKSIFPPEGKRVLTIFKGGMKNPPTHQFFETDDELLDAAQTYDGLGKNVYHACAAYHQPTNRRGDNVQAIKSLWLDLDVGDSKPYATQKEAATHYEQFRVALGLPLSHVVSSGNGIHAYQPFTDAVNPKQWDKLANLYRACLDNYGVKHDTSRTTDKASILRVPGTSNHKTDPSKAVTLKRLGEEVPASELWKKLKAYATNNGVFFEAQPPRGKITETNDVVGNRLNHTPKDGVKVAERCPILNQVADSGGDVEHAIWWRSMGVAKHCADSEQIGMHWTRHREATGHDKTDYMGAMDDWTVGPTTCEAFSKHSPKCAGCEHKGKITSPIQLGTVDNYFLQDPGDPGAVATTHNNSDLALAKIFVSQNTGAVLRDHSARQWRLYRGGRWGVCAMGEHVERVKHCVPFILNMAADAIKSDPEGPRGKKLQALAVRAQSAKGISQALQLAESDPAMATTADKFDCDPDLFNVANGVVHLPTGKFMAHDPALMLAKQSPAVYDPEARCPEFLQFMEQVSCSDPEWVDYLQRQLGYVVSGQVHEEKLFFWFGDGRNGKSVLANIMRHIMGDYSVIAPAAMFMVSRRDGADATPQLAMLPGKRLMLANETEAGSRLSAQMLKVAVSTEHISARALHGNPFSFHPTHKAIMRGNHLPIIQEADEGTWRRIDLVPFDLKLTPDLCDPYLEQKLKAQASGILNWLIQGHIKWRHHGLKPAARVRNASNTYRQNSDVIANFLADECIVGPAHEVEKVVAYMRYRTWAEAEGLRCMAKKSLTRALAERGYSDGRQTSGKRLEVYRGFRCN